MFQAGTEVTRCEHALPVHIPSHLLPVTYDYLNVKKLVNDIKEFRVKNKVSLHFYVYVNIPEERPTPQVTFCETVINASF